MRKIVSVQAKPEYILQVRFEDGLSGSIDLSSELFGPMFEPLRDPNLFDQASVDEFGAVCWPNGADLAPDALYEEILEQVRRAS